LGGIILSIFGGLFNYTKEGPGVSKDAPQKKRFFYFFELYFRKFWKLCLLNLIYLMACIPVVTIGPATAGATYVLRNFAREEHAYVWYHFWKAFKSNFKQSFIMGIINLIVYGLSGWVILFYVMNIGTNDYFIVLLAIAIIFVIVYSVFNYYTYLLMVTVNLSFKAIIKNSYIFTVLGIKYNFCVFLFSTIIVALEALFFPLTLPVVLFIGVSTPMFISVFGVYPVVKKYCIDPILAAEAEAEEEDEESVFSDKLLITDDTSDDED